MIHKNKIDSDNYASAPMSETRIYKLSKDYISDKEYPAPLGLRTAPLAFPPIPTGPSEYARNIAERLRTGILTAENIAGIRPVKSYEKDSGLQDIVDTMNLVITKQATVPGKELVAAVYLGTLANCFDGLYD